MMTSGSHWYVVHTQPNNESRAEVNLRRQGFTTYLPRYLRRRRHARRTEQVSRPLFPRYLFVCLDLTRDRWRSIQSTFGVNSVILAGETPTPLPLQVVEEIRAREDRDGFVTLGLPAGLKPGNRICLTDGLFADCQGVLERISDNRRVAVLLSLLGRKVRVFVPAASIGIV
jgi:transcriptional antiterminator RfaH